MYKQNKNTTVFSAIPTIAQDKGAIAEYWASFILKTTGAVIGQSEQGGNDIAWWPGDSMVTHRPLCTDTVLPSKYMLTLCSSLDKGWDGAFFFVRVRLPVRETLP